MYNEIEFIKNKETRGLFPTSHDDHFRLSTILFSFYTFQTGKSLPGTIYYFSPTSAFRLAFFFLAIYLGRLDLFVSFHYQEKSRRCVFFVPTKRVFLSMKISSNIRPRFHSPSRSSAIVT